MNHYARLAMDHCRQHRPTTFAAMADPTGHFARLGEVAQAQVSELRDQILDGRRASESLEDYRQRAYQARRQAEEIVMAELTGSDDAAPTPDTTALIEEDPDLASYYRDLALISETLSVQPAAWTDNPADPPPLTNPAANRPAPMTAPNRPEPMATP